MSAKLTKVSPVLPSLTQAQMNPHTRAETQVSGLPSIFSAATDQRTSAAFARATEKESSPKAPKTAPKTSPPSASAGSVTHSHSQARAPLPMSALVMFRLGLLTPNARPNLSNVPGAPMKPDKDEGKREKPAAYAPRPSSKKDTPQEVRNLVKTFEEISVDCDLTGDEQEEIDAGLKKVEELTDTPESRHLGTVAERLRATLLRNLSGGASPGSLEFHTKATTNLRQAAGWFKQVVPDLANTRDSCKFPPLALKAPKRIWNIQHQHSAEKSGKALVGLHVFCSDFSEKYQVHHGVENPSNGVCALHFTEKHAKTAQKPKFSTFFPRSITNFEVVMKEIDSRPCLARSANRELYFLQLEKASFYVEVFDKDRGLSGNSAFPYFAFLHYGESESYTITEKDKLSNQELFKYAVMALDKVNPAVASKDCPLRHFVVCEKEAILVLDISAFFPSLKIQEGIVVGISSLAFEKGSKAAAKIQDLINRSS
jgi:hypothetical protein